MTRPVSSRVSIIYLSICRGCETGDILYASGQAQDIVLACKKQQVLIVHRIVEDAMKIAAIGHLFLCFVMGKDTDSPEIYSFFSSRVVITDYIPSGKKNMNEFINVEKSHMHVCTYVLFQPFSPWLTGPAQLWPSSWKQLSMKYPWLKY